MYISDYFFQFYQINKHDIIDHFVTKICNNSGDVIDGRIYVKSAKVELARLLKWYYQFYPKSKIIGITGTNGKTTTSSIVYESLKTINKKVLWVGTGGIKSSINKIEKVIESTNTTPDIVKIYRYIYMIM